MDLIHLAQNRGKWRANVNKVMNLKVPKISGWFSFLRRTLIHEIDYFSFSAIWWQSYMKSPFYILVTFKLLTSNATADLNSC